MFGTRYFWYPILIGALILGFIAFCDSRRVQAGHYTPQHHPYCKSGDTPLASGLSKRRMQVLGNLWLSGPHGEGEFDIVYGSQADLSNPNSWYLCGEPRERQDFEPTPEPRDLASTPSARKKGSGSGPAPSESKAARPGGSRQGTSPAACSPYPHLWIRDASLGQTYRVIHRDGCAYRRWVHPDSPLVYAIPWETVNSYHTVPVEGILSVPLDREQPWDSDNPDTHMLVRRFDGTDERIFVYRDSAWEHVPDLATFAARGYRWQDVCAADADFWREVA